MVRKKIYLKCKIPYNYFPWKLVNNFDIESNVNIYFDKAK